MVSAEVRLQDVRKGSRIRRIRRVSLSHLLHGTIVHLILGSLLDNASYSDEADS